MHRPADDFKYVEPVEPVRYRSQLYISGTHLMPAHHYLPLNPRPWLSYCAPTTDIPRKPSPQLGILLGARKTCWRYKVVSIEQCQRCPRRMNLSHLFRSNLPATSGSDVRYDSVLEVKTGGDVVARSTILESMSSGDKKRWPMQLVHNPPKTARGCHTLAY